MYFIKQTYTVRDYAMRVSSKIGYVRVSTQDQNVKNQRLILQKEGVPRDLIFIDQGVSGSIPAKHRPGFRRLMNHITQYPDEVTHLYVVELTRLGRNTLETVTLIEELESRGIAIWSLSPNEAFTRSNDVAVRQLLLMIMAWVAERERANLVERTKVGLDRARNDGKFLGRPRRDIDWSVVEVLRDDGLSWKEVSEAIDMSVAQLYRRRAAAGLIEE
jgi:DNA invertase Pin-like site-specific DNA recombinase